MVHLNGYSKEEGFRFYSKLDGQKAKEMACNPKVCLLFYWSPLHRQIRIQGKVDRVSQEAECQVFSMMPRPNQISTVVSLEGELIHSHEELEMKYQEVVDKYSDLSVSIPKPDCWGGYQVQPRTVEFWQGQSTWVDDRIVFERKDGSDEWAVHRLPP
jgi:pyridoxamine-phosphate oxidase